jgi:hypothetical protein
MITLIAFLTLIALITLIAFITPSHSLSLPDASLLSSSVGDHQVQQEHHQSLFCKHQ